MATLAILLTLFSFPSLRKTCRGYGQRPPHYSVPTGDQLSDRVGDAGDGVNHFESAGTVRAEQAAHDRYDPSASLTPPPLRITRLAGSIAGAGHKVTVIGAGLGSASTVYFVAGDGTAREARFRAWDDGRLMVVVPDLGPRPRGATVVVSTGEGTSAPAVFYYTGR
jgi:hypothetical protein